MCLQNFFPVLYVTVRFDSSGFMGWLHQVQSTRLYAFCRRTVCLERRGKKSVITLATKICLLRSYGKGIMCVLLSPFSLLLFFNASPDASTTAPHDDRAFPFPSRSQAPQGQASLACPWNWRATVCEHDGKLEENAAMPRQDGAFLWLHVRTN